MESLAQFDPGKFFLGPLCKRGHEWRDTGACLRHVRNRCCAECIRIRSRDRKRAIRAVRAQERASVVRVVRSEKMCTKCLEEKPLAAFAPDSRYAGGLKAWCRACQTEYSREWRAKNVEKERERHRRVYAANPEKRRLAVRKSYNKHREKRNAETVAYRRAHPELRAAARARERARLGERYALVTRERGARRRLARRGVPVEVVDYAAILARDGFHCHICREAIEPQILSQVEFDHIIPPQHGGSHTAGNIAVAHCSCNKKKWNKLQW